MKHLLFLFLLTIASISSKLEIEPNNDFDSAQNIEANIDYIGFAPIKNKAIDFFKFKAEGYAFHLYFKSLTPEKRAYEIIVYNSKREQINYFKLNKGEQIIEKTIGVRPGTVYIKIYSPYDKNEGKYKIKVSGLKKGEID